MDTTNATGGQPMGTGSPMTGMPMKEMPKKSGGGFGALLAIILIVVVLAIGGLYYFTTKVNQLSDTATSSDVATDPQTQALAQQGSSDDLNSIQADLKATDVSNLNQGADVIGSQQ